MRLPLRLLPLLILLSAPSLSLGAADKTVVLQDHLGVAWTDELVHYRYEFPQGAEKDPASAVVQVKGAGAQPAQVSDVEHHADGSIRAMSVWFLATVPANGATTYLIGLNRAPTAGAADAGAAVARSSADAIELANGAAKPIGIRLPAGGKEFASPAPLTDVPGPIQSLNLPSGGRVGPGRWEVPFRVKSYRAEVTAAGPIFAEARVRYVFDTGYWNFTARVIRGCPMITVQEEFDTGASVLPWDKFDRFYTLPMNGSTFKPGQVFFAGRNDRDDEGDILKAVESQEWTKKYYLRPNWNASPINGYTPSFHADRDDFYLTGYPSVLPRVGCLCRFIQPGGDSVGFAGLNTADWRNPLSLRGRSNRQGELLMSLPLQSYAQGWSSDGFAAGSPNYTGQTLGVGPTTVRRTYGIMLSPAEDEKQAMLASLFVMAEKLGAHPLDRIKDWILQWPDPLASAKWAAKSSTAGATALDLLRKRVEFNRVSGNFGRFSMGYHYGFSHGELGSLQGVIDSTAALSAADRAEARRLLAFLAYDMHSPDTFPWATGFHLNNPNMSMMAVEARVASTQLIKDHPQFKAWNTATLELEKNILRRYIRDSGATYENPHYTLGVTFDEASQVNQFLIESGIGDAFDSDLFRKSTAFILNWLTPPDPRFLGHRMILPIGNCSYQSVPVAMATHLINYYKGRRPELAGQVQWWANQTLGPDKQIKLVKDAVPPLGSARFADYGVFFRHGFGTPYETLLLLVAGNCDGHCEWEADQMCYTLYAKGQPINLHFGNGYFPMLCRPWLRNRVSIDHKYEVSERNDTNVATASFNPSTEYARAYRSVTQIRPLLTEYPVLNADGRQWAPEEQKSWPGVPTNIEQIPRTTWFRQVLFLKDADPKGPNYFVLRDTFEQKAPRPTDLSLWFLANKMDRSGNTFHFDGQCKVDLDLFVNTPESFEPETGKYGHVQQPYGRDANLFDPKFYPGGKLGEEQLFIRIKQPAGKGYLVVLYPRLKAGDPAAPADPAAAFSRLADNVVRVETPLSIDYALLDSAPFEFHDDRVRFEGTAASVRFYKSGKVELANSEGKAKFTVGGKVATGEGPFLVTFDGGKATSRTFAEKAHVEIQ